MTITFDVVFAVFVVAMITVIVLVLRSAVRRDRDERQRRLGPPPAGGPASPEVRSP